MEKIVVGGVGDLAPDRYSDRAPRIRPAYNIYIIKAKRSLRIFRVPYRHGSVPLTSNHFTAVAAAHSNRNAIRDAMFCEKI